MSILDYPEEEDKEERPKRLVVKVTTSYWRDKKGIYSFKKIVTLKRKTTWFDFLMEDASNIGADEVFPRIINIDEVENGVYEVITCNHERDWETGYIEDYDYKLIPYKE